MTPKHFQNKISGSNPPNDPHSLDTLSRVNLSGTLEIVDGEIVIHGSDIEWSLSGTVGRLKKQAIHQFCVSDLYIANEAVSSIVKGKNVFNVHVSLVSKNGIHYQSIFQQFQGNSIFWFVKRL